MFKKKLVGIGKSRTFAHEKIGTISVSQMSKTKLC